MWAEIKVARDVWIAEAWRELLEHARAVPAVEAIAMVDTVPMRGGNNPLGYWTSAALPAVQQRPMALTSSVSLIT